ncbi:MAG: bifunctional folylpolyglutamate synthase/dihydrofolate synthase [Bacteroidales bacterium]|nr:bifunctional folylpolyglutamate synthase/dihydrofolate synthase [Bacteroidales bacterium]
MTYQETLDFMYAQLPMYHRIGAAAYKADLQPTLDLMEALGHPERRFRSIHVAGTNGKGSVSHMLASILQEAGYKVGLYTSPHLVDFRERIRINGEMIPEAEVVRFIDCVNADAPATNAITQSHNNAISHLSFFEMTVGLAFDYFAREQVDIAVIEVGMGGRLDSTNVITPLLSVITNIGLDHTQFLGDTLEKIAREKAGIIKPHVPVVIGETQPETAPVFRAIAAERHAPITFADEHYHVDRIEDYTEQLTGEYQKKNIATVLECVNVLMRYCASADALNTNALTQLNTNAIKLGLARVVTNTHLQGRWQTIGTEPLTICETAHNEPGIRAMLGKLPELLGQSHLHVVYGCVNDKDYNHILQFLVSQFSLFNFHFSFYFSQPSVPRGLPVADLQAAARELGIEGDAYPNVKDAIAAARAAADPQDLVLVTGSIFLVADALA